MPNLTEIMDAVQFGKQPLTAEQSETLLNAYLEQRQDLKLLKDNIYQVLQKLAIVKPDGTLGKPDMKKLMATLMQAAMSPGKLAEDFSFLTALGPLIEKYKDL